MKKIILLAFAFQFFCFPDIFCQDLAANLNQYLSALHAKRVIPGFSVVVVKDDKVVFCKGYGTTSVNKNVPFNTKTVLGIGSLAKSFTAMAVLTLVEEGKIELDATVTEYIPWFRTANKDKSDLITVRMLINNTSGLYSPSTVLYHDDSALALENFTKGLKSTYLTRTPGTVYEYSNTGFNVAGFLVQTMSGIPFPEYLKRKIFIPLQMDYTSTDVSELSKLSPVEGHYQGIHEAIAAYQETEKRSGEYIPSGSLLCSNAEDIGKYLIALLDQGKKSGSVASEKNLSQLFRPNVRFPGLTREQGGDGTDYAYALGWMVSTIDGVEYCHHGGSTGKTSGFTIIDLKNNIAASVLLNLDVNFIDPYAYPTLFNIGYNIIRVSKRLAENNFARPTIADRTVNDFELRSGEADAYCGKYIYKSGGDFVVYYGVDLEIRKVNGRLTGRVIRGNRTINEFEIDFVNRSLAVSRNIGEPSDIRFSLKIDGVVRDVFYKNVRFIRVVEKPLLEHSIAIAMDNDVAFELPVSWNILENSPRHLAAELHEFYLEGFFSADRSDLKNYKTLTGKITMKALNKESPAFMHHARFWRQSTGTCEKNGNIDSIMVLSTEVGEESFNFLLVFPAGTKSHSVKEVFDSFMASVVF